MPHTASHVGSRELPTFKRMLFKTAKVIPDCGSSAQVAFRASRQRKGNEGPGAGLRPCSPERSRRRTGASSKCCSFSATRTEPPATRCCPSSPSGGASSSTLVLFWNPASGLWSVGAAADLKGVGARRTPAETPPRVERKR